MESDAEEDSDQEDTRVLDPPAAETFVESFVQGESEKWYRTQKSLSKETMLPVDWETQITALPGYMAFWKASQLAGAMAHVQAQKLADAFNGVSPSYQVFVEKAEAARKAHKSIKQFLGSTEDQSVMCDYVSLPSVASWNSHRLVTNTVLLLRFVFSRVLNSRSVQPRTTSSSVTRL